MKHILIVLCTVILILACSAKPAVHKMRADSQPEAGLCTNCHTDLGALLSKGHPAVAGNDMGACSRCHKPAVSQKAAPNKFSATLHRAHANEKSDMDCDGCHSWVPGNHFGIHGANINFGPVSEKDMALLKKTTFSWAGSRYLDARHAEKNVTCSGCHGDTLPTLGDTVENDRCLVCHGSYDSLAEKTKPEIFPERNPHKSHLGVINCTVCHFAHSESKAYCLECHPKFNMKPPG